MLEFLQNNTWFVALAGILVMGFLFWLRVYPFSEKPSKEPEQSARARLLTRRVKSGADRTGRSRQGFNFVLTFELDDGSQIELYAFEEEYGAMREGMFGRLTWQGRYFVDFQADELYKDIAEWAAEDCRSVNAQIDYLLTACVRAHKAGKK